MNMACTRARDVLYIIGSKLTMAKSVEGEDDEEAKKMTADSFTSIHRKTTDVGGIRQAGRSTTLRMRRM